MKGKLAPLCPGCGEPMECSLPHLYVYETLESLRYICGYRCGDYKCGWAAPIGRGKTPAESREDAYVKAKRRFTDADKQQTKGRTL